MYVCMQYTCLYHSNFGCACVTRNTNITNELTSLLYYYTTERSAGETQPLLECVLYVRTEHPTN